MTQFFTWLLAAVARKHTHACAHKMLRLDDHLLRDIGLTQNDVLNCMSKPAQMAEGCLPTRRSENLEIAAAAPTRQTAPSPDGLAA